MSNDDYRFVSHNLFHRMMRRNGKLYSFDFDIRVSRYCRKRFGFLVELQHVRVPPMAGFDPPRLWDCKYDHYNTDCKLSRSRGDFCWILFFLPKL
jgi:hypothetical protein